MSKAMLYSSISLSKQTLTSSSLFSRFSTLQSLIFAMAGTGENFSSAAAAEDSVNFGFDRAEMYSQNIFGTVDPYDRHVFLCYNTYDAWPARVEASDSDPLPKRLAAVLKSRKNEIKVKTRLTICEGRDGTELLNGDVLIFPEMIKYRGLTETGVDSFVEDVLVNGEPWAFGVQEALTGSHVFICAHNSRDRRCGVCGPALMDKFNEEIELKGLKDQVFVSACSHVGGHKYAGNLIIFSADLDGKITGHWYGYVAPHDVSELLDQHIGKSEIIGRIWRGKMGGIVKEAEKVDEQNLPNGNVTKNEIEKEPQPQESSQEEKPNAESCCQGTNGISCCREGTKDEVLPSKENMTSCCQGANGNSCGSNEFSKKEVKKPWGRLANWAGKWEQHELFAAAGVIGAVATAGVVYSLYKRSR